MIRLRPTCRQASFAFASALLSASAAHGLSLLAVGDTGRPPHWLAASNGQIAVARGMDTVDRRRPIDALLFLGDNFYFAGLLRRELVDRVRDNLVLPHCRFFDLSAPRSAEVEDACPISVDERHPVPVFAVLGNHDVESPESPSLESEEIPRFIANWRLPSSPVEVVELEGGVSLVLLDSNRLIERSDPAPLADALRRSRGPWRVLVAHHPIGTSLDKGYSPVSGFGRYGELVRRAIDEAGVSVPLMLAGHEHNLQLLAFPRPAPALMAIVGTGGDALPVRSTSGARRFSLPSLGFARVDFPDAPSGRVVVRLFATSKARAMVGLRPKRVARWSVDAAGRVHDEDMGEHRSRRRGDGLRKR